MALFRFNFGDDADKSIFESGSNTDFHLYSRTSGTARTVFAGICVTGNSYLGNAAGDTTTVCGNLVVTGNTTTINSTTLQVDDKNIELGTVDTPTDSTADGGGITLKGATDKTILWTNSTDSWDFNQTIKSPTICATTCVDIADVNSTAVTFRARAYENLSCMEHSSSNNNSSTLAFYNGANTNTICLRSHGGVIWSNGRVETPTVCTTTLCVGACAKVSNYASTTRLQI